MYWALVVFVFLGNDHSYNFEIGRYPNEHECHAQRESEMYDVKENGDEKTISLDCVQHDDNV